MGTVVEGVADGGDVAEHAGRSLVVDGGDGFDGVLIVCCESVVENLSIDAATPVAGQQFYFETQLSGDFAPEVGEVAGLEHQYPVAGRECIGERSFPGAGAGRWVDHNGRGCGENLLEACEYIQSHLRKFGAAMIDGRSRDGPGDALGQVGGAGNL